MSDPVMANNERLARNAVWSGEKKRIDALQSESMVTKQSGTAGIAAGQAGLRLSESAAVWAKRERKISHLTLERLGVASGMVFFPDLGRQAEALFFRYPEGWKARSFPEKAFVAGKGLKLAFWNIDRGLAA